MFLHVRGLSVMSIKKRGEGGVEISEIWAETSLYSKCLLNGVRAAQYRSSNKTTKYKTIISP